MWDACVGVYQLLNWKMHGGTLKFYMVNTTQWYAIFNTLCKY